MQTYCKRYSRQNMSDRKGNVGQVLAQHCEEMRELKTNKDIEKFITAIRPEMNDEAKKYIDDEFLKGIHVRPFYKNYQFLYNIYLAGYSDLKISNVGKGQF